MRYWPPTKLPRKMVTPSPKNSPLTFYFLIQMEIKNKILSLCTNLLFVITNYAPTYLLTNKRQNEIWRNIINLIYTLTFRPNNWIIQIWERCKPVQLINPINTNLEMFIWRAALVLSFSKKSLRYQNSEILWCLNVINYQICICMYIRSLQV